jgi:hypothetical protein
MSESARRCASWVEGRECATALGRVETTLSRPLERLASTAVQAWQGGKLSPMAPLFMSKNPNNDKYKLRLLDLSKFCLKTTLMIH